MDHQNKQSRLALFGKTAAVVVALFAVARITGVLGTCGLPGCGTKASVPDDRVASFATTDPELVKYRELKRIELGLDKPAAIALSTDGKLYAAGDRAVEVYNVNTGARVSSFQLNETPYCMSVAPDGKIFIGMRDHIEVYEPTGTQTAVWGSLGGKAYVTSIAANSEEVWAADAGNRVILQYGLDGQLLATFGKKDSATGAPGIVVPSPHLDVASDGAGGVWVANPGRHQLEQYSADGKLTRKWGKTGFAYDGFSGCCNPTDFALTADGKFVTAEKGIARVKIYSSDGKFEGIVAGSETFKQGVVGLDLAADSNGHIYVLDPASKSVRVYVSRGNGK